ncbi:hypothetical protein ScPMuIL_014241 [Solemya velum]
MPALDIAKLDLYGILEVTEDATDKEIVKAYRQRARKCHPDKNPDNPAAVDLFHKLSKALEVLTDAAAKAAYDKIIKAKKAAKARHRVLDEKRKKFKEDLEARENASQDTKVTDLEATKKLAAEIERLRKEGSKLLEQEQELLREEMKRSDLSSHGATEVEVSPKLRVKWKSKKADESNGGYDYAKLKSIFQKYGEVSNLIVSQKKKGSAIVEFGSQKAAVAALSLETGEKDNPLTLSWLSGQPCFTGESPEDRAYDAGSSHMASDTFDIPIIPQDPPKQMFSFSSPQQPMSSQERDFESIVLMKMRQANERQKLIEQMQKEDEDEKS